MNTNPKISENELNPNSNEIRRDKIKPGAAEFKAILKHSLNLNPFLSLNKKVLFITIQHTRANNKNDTIDEAIFTTS